MHFTTAIVAPLLAGLAAASPLSQLQARDAMQIPSDCTATYIVQSGDFCGSNTLGAKFGNFTYTQLFRWNPQITQTCNLFIGEQLCINSVGYVFTPPVQSPGGNIVSQNDLPVPIIGCAVSNCQKWIMVGSGDLIGGVTQKAGITQDQFISLNPCVSSTNPILLAEYWYCIG